MMNWYTLGNFVLSDLRVSNPLSGGLATRLVLEFVIFCCRLLFILARLSLIFLWYFWYVLRLYKHLLRCQLFPETVIYYSTSENQITIYQYNTCLFNPYILNMHISVSYQILSSDQKSTHLNFSSFGRHQQIRIEACFHVIRLDISLSPVLWSMPISSILLPCTGRVLLLRPPFIARSKGKRRLLAIG